jgi:hypothetical protein
VIRAKPRNVVHIKHGDGATLAAISDGSAVKLCNQRPGGQVNLMAATFKLRATTKFLLKGQKKNIVWFQNCVGYAAANGMT